MHPSYLVNHNKALRAACGPAKAKRNHPRYEILANIRMNMPNQYWAALAQSEPDYVVVIARSKLKNYA